jgi:hypothetical protein
MERVVPSTFRVCSVTQIKTALSEAAQSSRSCAGMAKDFGTEFGGTAKRQLFLLWRKLTSETLAKSC